LVTMEHIIYLKYLFTENCPPLTNNSALKVNVAENYEGGVASYQCVNNSYTLVGLSTRECLSDGTWGGSAPSCLSKFNLKI